MALYRKAFIDCNTFTISMLYARMVDAIFCEIIDRFILLMAEFGLDVLLRAAYWSLKNSGDTITNYMNLAVLYNMSDNLVSQQLPVPSMQIGQMNKMESSVSEMQMGVVGSLGPTNDSALLQFSVADQQIGLMDPMSINSVSHGLSATSMQVGQIEAGVSGTLESQHFSSPNNQIGGMGLMLNNGELQQSLVTSKRKAAPELISPRSMAQHLATSNKRMAQIEHRPWLLQASSSNKRVVQLESLPNGPGSPHLQTSNKKMVKTDSFSNKSGSQRASNQKNQAQAHASAKVSRESSESVRSKMRESLAAALAMVNQLQSKPLDSNINSQGKTEENNQPYGAASTAEPAPTEPKLTLPSNHKVSTLSSDDIVDGSSKLFADSGTGDSMLTFSVGTESQSNNILTYNDVPFSDNLFVKDELLQGNGLSWVLDSDFEAADRRKIQDSDKQKSGHDSVGGDSVEAVQTPEQLAFKIEVELFKLFGGVNKKYKEKGRSLLFNLKDRNNPELRQRVVSGEIPPYRLCSMSAEELASKELSEWRIAKAEELAQMVVLPDTEVDIRRLVKKTHKGEFQVEVAHDDSIPVEDSVGSSSNAQGQSSSREVETLAPSKPRSVKGQFDASTENNVESHSTLCTLTIPTSETTDLLQGLMADDGFKDAEFLTPIVSLDEFMQSLDTEPPFENLQVESVKTTSISDKVDSDAGSDSKSSGLTAKSAADASFREYNVDDDPKSVDDSKPTNDGANVDSSCCVADAKFGDLSSDAKFGGLFADGKSSVCTADVKSSGHTADMKSSGHTADMKSIDHPVKLEAPVAGKSMGEHIWEGSLQLNISTTAPVRSFFTCGEKTSAREWPSILEIKGRVRLDAFEKFLQQLPLSKSRAVMVVRFVLKEMSTESELKSLQEVAGSYIQDERVGFAEPISGVELYICPPHNKTFEMLGKIIQKEHVDAFNAIDNGLIGVIVWRKLIPISPNSSSHHKHSSRKQHVTSRKQQDTNLNTPRSARPQPQPDDDNDSDVPPGFGPPAARGDDLPEFNFPGSSNQSMSNFSSRNSSRQLGTPPFHSVQQTPNRPVEQVRELIHKYGQTNTGAYPGNNWKEKGNSRVAMQPWDDDDDDDIPEWQPNAPQQHLPPQQMHNLQQQTLRPHFVNQPHFQSHQTSMNVPKGPENPALWQQHQGTWWAPPAQTNSVGNQPDVGQLYAQGAVGQPGVAWQNAPKSRGF